MRKGLITVIVLIIIVVGGYAIFHKSPSTNNSNGNTNNTASQNTTPAVNNAVVVTKTDSKVGQYLADPSGKPLYTYGSDSSGVSNCTSSCLTTWPAYTPSATLANLPSGIGTIKRSDNGQTQYTYNGMPLYYFASDSQGKVTGDGVENFHVAKPSAASSQSNTTSPSDNSSNGNSSSPY